jgi:hypothetical protein
MEKYMCWYANKEPYVPHDKEDDWVNF